MDETYERMTEILSGIEDEWEFRDTARAFLNELQSRIDYRDTIISEQDNIINDMENLLSEGTYDD